MKVFIPWTLSLPQIFVTVKRSWRWQAWHSAPIHIEHLHVSKCVKHTALGNFSELVYHTLTAPLLQGHALHTCLRAAIIMAAWMDHR